MSATRSAPRGVREAVRAGEPWGLMGQARLDAKEGDCLAAESAYEAAAAAGVQAAFASLVELRWRAGDLAGKRRRAQRRRRAGAGHWKRTERLGAASPRVGGPARGEAQALTARPPTGRSTRSPTSPVPVRESGDRAGAERSACKAAWQDDAEAWVVPHGRGGGGRDGGGGRRSEEPPRWCGRHRRLHASRCDYAGKLARAAARAPERCRSRGCRRSGEPKAWAVTCPCVRERADDPAAKARRALGPRRRGRRCRCSGQLLAARARAA